jgi:uncharacterized cupin superfamily protein
VKDLGSSNSPLLVYGLSSASVELGPKTPKARSVTAGQMESIKILWSSSDGLMEVGVWEASPGSFPVEVQGRHEACQILSGEVEIVSSDGQAVLLRGGDTVTMASGWAGVWHVRSDLRKAYVNVLLEPESE